MTEYERAREAAVDQVYSKTSLTAIRLLGGPIATRILIRNELDRQVSLIRDGKPPRELLAP